MKYLRLFLGGCLIVTARVAMQAARVLSWLGRAVMPKTPSNEPQRVSVSRTRVVKSHSIRTRCGAVSLYRVERD